MFSRSLEDDICVIGLGPIGCMMLELTRVFGASKVFAAQRSRTRLDMARRYLPGARYVATMSQSGDPGYKATAAMLGQVYQRGAAT